MANDFDIDSIFKDENDSGENEQSPIITTETKITEDGEDKNKATEEKNNNADSEEEQAKNAAMQMMEFLNKMSMQNNSAFLQQMTALVEQITKSNGILAETQKRQLEATKRSFGIRSVTVDEIDPADVLETPALFFCWGSHTAIWDDFRNGMAIETPYKRPIVFNPLSRMRSKATGKVQTVCFARVFSKKEAEFVRKHSECQTKYFESITNVQQQDNELIQFAIEANAELNKMTQHAMFSYAANIRRPDGSPVGLTTADPDVIRKIVLDDLVAERMKTHNEYRQRTLSTEFEMPVM